MVNEYDDLIAAPLVEDTALVPNNRADDGGYDALIDNDAKVKMRNVARVNADVTSEQAVRAHNLSRQYGAPTDVIMRNEKQYSDRAALDAIDYDGIQSNAPVLAKALSDPRKAPLVKDDIASMMLVERIARDFGQSYSIGEQNRRLSNLGEKSALGTITPSERLEMQRIKDFQPVEYGVPHGLDIPSAMVESLPIMGQTTLRAGRDAVAVGTGAAAATFGIGMLAAPTVPEEIVTVPSAFIAGTATSFPYALAAESMRTEFGLAFAEYQDFIDDDGNKISREVALPAAAMSGVASGLLESFGLGKILEQFPAGKQIMNRLSKDGVQSLMRTKSGQEILARFGKSIGTAAVSEGLTEAMQEATQSIFGELAKATEQARTQGNFNAFQEYGIDENGEMVDENLFWSRFVDRIAEAGVQGAKGGAGFGAAGAATTTAYEMARESRLGEKSKAVLEKAKKSAADSKLFQKDPAIWQEMTEQTLGKKDVFVDAGALQTYFQSHFESEEAGLAALSEIAPELPAQMREAAERGGDVTIPANAYARAVNERPEFAGLGEIAREHPEALYEEAFQEQYFSRIIPEVGLTLQELEMAGNDPLSGEELHRRLASEFQGAGFSADVATRYAGFARAFYDTQKKRGEDSAAIVSTIEDMFSRLRIRDGSAPLQRIEEASGFDFDDLYIDRARSLADGSRRPAVDRRSSLLDFIRDEGGVRSDEALLRELINLDVDKTDRGKRKPKAQRILKAEGDGGRFLDDLALSAFENGYFPDRMERPSVNEFLEAIEDETRGTKRFAQDEPDVEVKRDNYAVQFMEQLDRMGIDLTQADNASVKAAIHAAKRDYERDQIEATFNQPVMLGVDPDAPVSIVDLSDVGIKGVTQKDLLASVRSLIEQYGKFNTADEKRVMRLLAKDARHLTYPRNRQGAQSRIWKRAVLNLPALLENSIHIESAPNRKPKSKSSDGSYHRFYVPVRFGEDVYTMRLVARQTKDGMIVDPDVFDLYEVIPERSDPLSPAKPSEREALSLTAGKKGDTLTVRDMLAGVKDVSGHSYFQSAVDDDALDVNNRGGSKRKKERLFYQPRPRGAITLPDNVNQDYIISLFEGRDLSTALHEMGHFFLEVQRAVAEHPEASRATKEDWQKTLKWLGVEKSEDIGVDQHEKFARGMEVYLFEGNAPSHELRDMFRRFKGWMLRIYKEAKHLYAPVSDEMRHVFERMLATDQQIDAVKNDKVFRADPNVSFLLNREQREAYEQQRGKAVEAAKEKLLVKLLKEKERENKAWWKEEREKIEADVTREVQKQPDFRAYNYIKSGKVYDDKGDLAESLDSGYKLDRKALKEMYGEEIFKNLPKGLVSKEGGVHPLFLADLFGYSGVDHMVRRLANVPDFKKTIQRVTDRRMADQFGDMLNDGTIEREALSLLHNDEGAEVISQELQAVAKAAAENVPSKEAFKRRAQEIISGKVIEKIKPSNYYYAEISNSRKAGEALAKKDYKKYAEHKGKQLLNHYLYREAVEAREYVDKSMKRFTNVTKQPARGKVRIDEDYRQRIIEMLDKYELGSRISNARRTRLEMRAFNMWIGAKRMNDNAQLILPEELVRADSKTHYRDLTLEEFRALRDTVDNLATQGRRKNEITINGKKADLQEAVDKITLSIISNNKGREAPLQTRTAKENFKHKVENFFMNTIKARTMIRQMDGFKDLGAAHTHLMAPIDDAEIAKARRMRQVTKDIEVLFKKHYGSGLAGIASPKSAVYIPKLRGTLQKDGILAMALNWGNVDNREKLIDGLRVHHYRGLMDTDILQIFEEHMTKADWDFVQEAWTYIDSFWPEIAALEKERAGFAPQKVDGDEFTINTKDGQRVYLEGGYYPIKYDDRKNANVGAFEKEDIAQLMRAGRFARAQTRRGHVNERMGSAEYPIRLDLGVLFQHVQEVVTDLTMSEAIDTTYKVLTHKETKEYIVSFFGKNTYDQLDIWLKDVSVGSISKAAAFDSIADHLRAGLSISVMGFKVSTTLVQLTGYTQSIVRIGAPDMLRGMAMFLGNGDPSKMNENAQFAMAKSKILADRSETFHRDIYDTMRIMQSEGTIKTKIAQAAFWPIVKMQMLVDIPTWMGAYQKGQRLFDGDDDAAVRYADEQLIMAQSSGLFKDLSGFERGSTSAQTRLSPVIRLWTSFYSFFNAKLNLAYEKTVSTDFKKPRDVARLASDYLLLFWVEAVIGEFLLQRAPDFEEGEDDPLWWNLKLGLSNMAATIPFLREISSGLQGFDAAPAGLRGLDEVAKATKTVGNTISDIADPDEEVNAYKVFRNLNSAAGIIFKYPAAQLNQAVRAMEQSSDGEDVQPIDYLLHRP